MANDNTVDHTLAALRRESGALRRLAPPKRKQFVQPKQAEFMGLIAKALASSAAFERMPRNWRAPPTSPASRIIRS